MTEVAILRNHEEIVPAFGTSIVSALQRTHCYRNQVIAQENSSLSAFPDGIFKDETSVTVDLHEQGGRVTLLPSGWKYHQAPEKVWASMPMQRSPVCPFQSSESQGLSIQQSANSIRLGSAVVFVSKDGRLLVTQRSFQLRAFPGGWVVPGGHVDTGETLQQAAARELFEEVGINFPPEQLQPLCVWESAYPPTLHHGPPKRQHVAVYWLAKSDQCSKEIMLAPSQGEVGDCLWLHPTDALGLSGMEGNGQIVAKAEEDWQQNYTNRLATCSQNLTLGTVFAMKCALCTLAAESGPSRL